jgi:hypothetical protein
MSRDVRNTIQPNRSIGAVAHMEAGVLFLTVT